MSLIAPPSVGVPEPPSDVKGIVEKTAAFVARLGESFERKVLEKEKANPKFSFLQASNPYHAYYLLRLQVLKPTQSQVSHTISSASTATSAASVPQSRQLQPPPRDQFSVDQPNISALDLETIKLTALFVARNGQSFQIGLINREQRNPQFDFLKPTDALYPYFSSLVEQYRTVLLPQRSIEQTLKQAYSNHFDVLSRLSDRADWELMQERARKTAERDAQLERDAIAKINWQDFVVVETIDLEDEDEEMKDQQEIEKKQPEKQEENVEMDVDNEPQPPPQPPPQQQEEEQQQQKPQRQQQPKKKNSGMTQLCPKCGQQIAIEEFSEHLRIELIDPRARGQKQLAMERGSSSNSALALDEDIGKNLAKFARKRTDIFGSREAELAAIERAIRQEKEEKLKQTEVVTWDGHSSSAPVFAAIQQQQTQKQPAIDQSFPQPLQQQQQQQQIPQIIPQKQQSIPIIPIMPIITQQPIVPPLPPPPSKPIEQKPLPPPPPPPPEDDEEPVVKKQHISEQLIPEQQFLGLHGGANKPMRIQIKIPVVEDKPEWKLQGESITVETTLGELVSQIKNKIKDRCGIPQNKQKLSFGPHAILKDTNSLAFYNVLDSTLMNLKIKERGGKKK